MEDKALRGDQFALNLLNYMGSCWTVGPGSKTLEGGGGGGGGGMLARQIPCMEKSFL